MLFLDSSLPLGRLNSERSTSSGFGNGSGLLSLDPGIVPEYDDELFSSSQLSAFVQASPSSNGPNLRSAITHEAAYDLGLVFDSNTSDSDNVEDSGLNSDVENLNPQGQGSNPARQGTYSNVLQLGSSGEVNNRGQTFDIGVPGNIGQARDIGGPFNIGQARDIGGPFNIGQVRDIGDPFNIGQVGDIGDPGNIGQAGDIGDPNIAGTENIRRVDAVVGAAFAREPMQQDIVIEDENHEDEMPAGDNVDSNSEGNWLSYSELMLDSYPAKSKIIYLKAYKMFERYLKSKKQFVANVAPTEIQILNYFYYLRHEKNLAPTTLWSTYSRVNACVKRLYGFSLKNFVRVSDVLKSYESGYKVKKASIFSPQEV